MDTAYLFGIATLCCWTISVFLTTKLARLEHPALLNKASLFFSIFLLGILTCIADGIGPVQLFSLPGREHWFWLGVSGVVGKSVGDYCGFTCARILGARRRSMISTITPGFTWLCGLAILGEQLSLPALAGMAVTSISLLMFIKTVSEREEIVRENFGRPLAGFVQGVLGAALTALAFVLSKKAFVNGSGDISEFHGTWIRVVTAFIALFLFDLLARQNKNFIMPFIRERQKLVLFFCAILFGTVLGLSFSLFTVTHMKVAAAYTIFALTPVAVTIVSALLLKKNISFKSWLYSLLAIAGALLLIWRNNLEKI